MAKFKFKGLDEYIEKLEKLEFDSSKYLGEALYKGAGIAADIMKSELLSIPVDDRPNTWGMQRKSIRSVEKAGLINGFGISPQQEKDGAINVKLGVHGYNKLGQANIVIARSLESGTSFMPKNRVFTRGQNKAKKECEKAIEESIKISIEKIM